MILTNGFDPDIRVLKESLYLSRYFKVEVLAWNRKNYNFTNNETINENLSVIRFKHTSQPGTGIRQIKQYIKYVFSIKSHLKKNTYEYIHCHDFDGLLAGYLSTLLMIKKQPSKIIYDAHEFELGRNTSRMRNPFALRIIKFIEGQLIKKVTSFIFVSQGQKDLMNKTYKLKQSAEIIRNIPPMWDLNEEKVQKNRKYILKQFEPLKITHIIMYHGIVNVGRGIENLLKVLFHLDNVGLVILGKGPKEYYQTLYKIAKELNVSKYIHYEKFVEYNKLYEYVGIADLGMVVLPNKNKSEVISLPNKLFENIQALTPVIVSDFPDMREIVHSYKIGEVVNPDDINDIVEKTKMILSSEKNYLMLKKNLLSAKNDLYWDKEIIKINRVYNIF